MRFALPAFAVATALLAGCGARTPLDLEASSVDGASPDGGSDSGNVADATADTAVPEGCAPAPCTATQQWDPTSCACVPTPCPNDSGEVVLATVPPNTTGWVLAVRDGTVFFTALAGPNNTGGMVMSVPRCGGTPTTLASGQIDPDAIAVDGTNLYWGNQGDDNTGTIHGGVMAESLAGGAPWTLADAGVFTGQIASDGTYVYATATVGYFGAWREPIGGGATTTLFTTPSYVYDVVVDGTHAYVSEIPDVKTGGRLLRVPVAGGNVTTLAPTDLQYPGLLAIDDQAVYYQGATAITRVAKKHGTPTALAPASPNAMVSDGVHVYWVEGNATTGVPGALFRVATSGGAAMKLSATIGYDVAVDDLYVYWINSNQVLRRPK